MPSQVDLRTAINIFPPALTQDDQPALRRLLSTRWQLCLHGHSFSAIFNLKIIKWYFFFILHFIEEMIFYLHRNFKKIPKQVQ